MKRLFSLLLCLALFLPVMAMAEAAPTLSTIDFGDFTMDLYDGDYYEIAPQKTNNAVYAQVYPAYNESDVTHNNFNVVWCKDDVSASFALPGGPEANANSVLKAAREQYESMGIKMTDEKVVVAKYEDGLGAFITFANIDYTGAGLDLITPMYQLQAYYCKGSAGTYIFTFSAATFEDLEAMSAYLDTIKFK